MKPSSVGITEHRRGRFFKQAYSYALLVLLLIVLAASSGLAQQKTKTPEEWIELGDADFRRQDYQQAVSKYTNALEGDPENKRALLKRAETNQLLKKFKFSLADIDALIRIQPDHIQALSMKGQIALSIGLFDEAISALEALIKLKPQNEDAKEKLKKALTGKELYNSIVKMESNDLDEKFGLTSDENNAKQCVQVMTKLLGEEVSARESVAFYIERAHCSLRGKYFPMVMQDIRSVYSKDPTNVQATIIYAKYLYLLGDTENAKNTIKNKCLRADPEHRACKDLFKFFKQSERLSEQANTEMNNRNYVQAISALEDYISLMENDAKAILPGIDITETQVKLCEAYSESQENTLANKGIEVCTAIINSQSDDSEFKISALVHRAQLYLTLEDLDKAKEDANKVKEGQAGKYQQKLQGIFQRIQQQEKINSQKDYYKALGFDRKTKNQVTQDDIRKAYRKLVKLYHPDKHRSQEEKDKAGKKYKEVTEAYEVLSDEQKKQRYDAGEFDPQQGEQQGHGGHPFNSFFQQGFQQQGGFPGGGGGFRFHFG